MAGALPSWHGTSRQNYDGGQVKVQLYVQDAVADTGNKEYKDDDGYVAVGEPVEMTVPLMKSEVAVGSGSDPTLTGSYVVSADNFSLKQLPATVKYKIKWANHTAFRIMSPENQRSLVATRCRLPRSKDSQAIHYLCGRKRVLLF